MQPQIQNDDCGHTRLGYLDSWSDGQFLLVSPSHWNQLRILMSNRVDLTNNEAQGCHLERRCEILAMSSSILPELDSSDDSETQFDLTYPGFLPVVFKLLTLEGIQVLAPEGRVRPLTARQSGEQHYSDDNFGLFVLNHDRGLVFCGGSVNRTSLIAQLASAYPDATMAIATAKIKDATRIGRELRQLGIDVTNVNTQWEPNFGPLRVVGTYQAIMSCWCVALASRDILIVPDAVQSLGRTGRQMLGRAFRARIIGLLTLDRQLTRQDADLLRAFYGFAELVIPAHGQKRHPVDVQILRFRGARTAPLDGNLTSLLCREIWRNLARNRVVSSLARRIELGDSEALARHPEIARLVREKPSIRIAVLAGGTEHLSSLAKELPDWPLVAGETIWTDGLQKQDREILDRCIDSQQAPDRVIATFTGADRINLAGYDVVIRADAGIGLPPIVDRVSANSMHRLQLVDVADRHHPVLRKWARQRHKAYLRQGWYAPGADPVEERVKQFLEDRPGGPK